MATTDKAKALHTAGEAGGPVEPKLEARLAAALNAGLTDADLRVTLVDSIIRLLLRAAMLGYGLAIDEMRAKLGADPDGAAHQPDCAVGLNARHACSCGRDTEGCDHANNP